MSDDHADAVAELRLLGEALVERIEPMLRLVTDNTAATDSCDNCPLCLTLALIRGEKPELMLELASKFSAVVLALQAAFEPKKPAAAEPSPTAEKPTDEKPAAAATSSRYQPIDVRLIS